MRLRWNHQRRGPGRPRVMKTMMTGRTPLALTQAKSALPGGDYCPAPDDIADTVRASA
jgi:hypothetical protein